MPTLAQQRRAALEHGRRWICVAIDCATKSILALRLSENPSADASRAARKVLTRSTASLRGQIVAMLPAYEWLRKIHYESGLEYRFLCLMLIRQDVFDLREHARPDKPNPFDTPVSHHEPRAVPHNNLPSIYAF